MTNEYPDPKPGDHCRLERQDDGRVFVTHVAPCVDGWATGVVTNAATDVVIR